MKGCVKKFFLCALTCAAVLVSAMPAYAAEAEKDSSGFDLIKRISSLIADDGNEIPRAEFVNDSIDTPDLYVKKTVQSAVAGVEPPEDSTFRFTIKINGDFYRSQEYELYNKDGQQVFNRYDMTEGSYTETTDPDAPGVNVAFITDRNGSFTLKGGQTARFPSIGEGVDYEVSEEDISEPFVQTVPPSGAHQAGSVKAKGSAVEFVNTYYPESKSELAELRVSKTLLFPDGYELPNTPEFVFGLKLSGKPYGGQAFAIEGSGGAASSGVTDTDGKFRLKGGQTAIFSDVEVGQDYEVVEYLSESDAADWRQTGVTNAEGAVKAPVTYASVTNTAASFAVTKRMEGYSIPDTEFTFELTSGGSPLTVSYYLYDESHNLVQSDAFSTGEDGRFTLRAGQTALFVGLKPGTEYTVRELAASGYTQTSPPNNEGYTRTVDENSLAVLEFVNAFDGGTKLTLLKQDEEGAPLEGVAFKLRSGHGGLFSPYAKLEKDGDAWKFIGWSLTGGTELTTDAEGTILLSGLEEGTYCLVEVSPLDGFSPMDDVVFVIGSSGADDGGSADVTIELSGSDAGRKDVSLAGSMKDGTGTLKLTNYSIISVPDTGGVGSRHMLLFGLVVMFIGVGQLLLRRRWRKA